MRRELARASRTSRTSKVSRASVSSVVRKSSAVSESNEVLDEGQEFIVV